ncbi:MAG: DUF4118 domain-containing protein [Oligoflexia bacterium]|nr:DUF4118 domain-containing protein [Oligoflexia bacterium]
MKTSEGKLRIFFGMCAGVGKTHAMLLMAKKLISEGVNVVIGDVNTHGKEETSKLLEGIPVVEKKKIYTQDSSEGDTFGDSFKEEMDLSAILKLHPKIVLIDNLAHTNIPGGLHPKRWQDVFEILFNGIDVFCTINIQNLESRKDDIERITGITITETVPDIVIERADYIDIIDIPPEDLLLQLKAKESKKESTNNCNDFFQEDKLTALREILFRVSADKVDTELKLLKEKQGQNKQIDSSGNEEIWKTQNKLLVAVGYGPFSEKLVRTTKQLADQQRSLWIALYVDVGHALEEREKIIVTKNLELARSLGAEVVTTADVDLVEGIDRICHQYQVSKIVIGKPGDHFIKNILKGGSIIERLNQLDTTIDIHIVRRPTDNIIKKEQKYYAEIREFFKEKRNYNPYILVTIWTIAITLLSALLAYKYNFISYRTVGIIFLLNSAIIGKFFTLFPTVFASILAIGLWDFFFIPPLFNLIIKSREDQVLCLSVFIVATLIGSFTSKIKRSQTLLRKREKHSNILYQIASTIVQAENRDDCIKGIESTITNIFKGECAITLKDKSGALENFKRGKDWKFNRPKEWEVALWAFENGLPAGKWTDNGPNAEAIYIPLLAKGKKIGVLAFLSINNNTDLTLEMREILFTICSQLAMYIQHELSTQQ